MKKTHSAKIRESFAPQVHRRFRRSRRRAGAGLQPPVRRRACRGAGRGRRQHRGQRVGRRQARRHLRHPRRARGNGTGHAYRPRPARREELECDWSKVPIEPITPGQNLARKRVWRDMATGGSRGIRGSHDYVRQGGAAARMMLHAGGGRPVERAGQRAHRRQRRHHARGLRALDELRQGRGGGGQADPAGSQEHQAQEPEGAGRSPASR